MDDANRQPGLFDDRSPTLARAAAAEPSVAGEPKRRVGKGARSGARGNRAPGEAPAEPDPPPAPARAAQGPRTERREDAVSMAARQREISVSEFFTKNRHLLGFDNPQKALLTAVKEAVDNSLDACEEAGILPDLSIEIVERAENRYRVAVQDNGPGIVRNQVPKIFGKLLYGSKFHRLKQQRGQQGIGISAAGMYAQLTTGRPIEIVSRTGLRKPAHVFELTIDTKKNAPILQRDEETDWEPPHGTRVELELEAVYKKGRRSVDDYVEQTALANPHVRIRYVPPKDEPRLYERVAEVLPKESKEIKPHPYGVELGVLLRLAKDTAARNVRAMLASEFSRVSAAVADEICRVAGVRPDARPSRLTGAQVELLFQAIPKVRILAPPTACLSPIGEELLVQGLEARVRPEFASAVTRPPAVYRGNPFQVEVGIAFGGELPAEEPVELYRYANRVPLQYQQSACAITKSVVAVDWKKYGLQQSRGAVPQGPVILCVHIASVWVPFTSESKEAVASYPEILREVRLGLMEVGRRLGTFVRRRRREADEHKKRTYIQKYIPHIGDALQEILGLSAARRDAAVDNLRTILERSRKI